MTSPSGVLPMTAAQRAPTVRSIGRALPAQFVDQKTLLSALKALWTERSRTDADGAGFEHLEAIHHATGVDGRHLVLPLASYGRMGSFAERNEVWIEEATQIAERAASEALARAGLEAKDVDHIFLVTVTGVATPSIDAKLVNRLGLRTDVKRTPVFGLGCVGGAAGTARASDYLRGFPDHVALLVAVELCSLTFQPDDLSMANVIATGLFGDGGAAVVLAGAGRAGSGPRIVATRSVFYPNSEEVMGWHIIDSGFQIFLSSAVPRFARERMRGDIDAFLGPLGLHRSQVTHWISHTGGPRVLEALEQSLELPANALARSWASLRQVGNLSSASVLFVMEDLLASGTAREGDWGLLMAMGPGFCSELVLLRW